MMRDDGMDGRMDRMMGGGWAGLLMPLAGLIALVVALVANQRGTQVRHKPGDESPRDILDRRYAAGELSAEEYRQAREDVDG